MTHLIDINLEKKPMKQPSFNFIRNSTKSSLTYSASPPKESHQSKQDDWSFIYETQQFQFNLLFVICTQNSSLNINCYLLNENLQIYKINTLSERILLINSFIKHKNSYQPKIDPSTGFIYFKVSFFDYNRWKGGGGFSIKNRSKDILKLFDLQKLMKSVQKLSESGLKMEDQHLTSSVWNGQKTYLHLSKLVSKLQKNNDLQQILSQRNNQDKKILLKKAQNSQFVKQINHFTSAKPSRETFISPLRLQNFVTSLSHDYNELSALVKRKAGRSNYDSLLINQSTNKKLNQLMINVVNFRESFSKQTLKILQAQLGKISLQIEREEQKKYHYKTSLLQLLPKNTEYHFLDKYFRSGLEIPILLRLSLKDESLAKFLQNNKKTISLETKMRLMLQLYSAVTILWEQNRIILYVNKLQNIFVTKNLTIKLRGLQSWYRPQPHILLEQKKQLNIKVVQNLMNLTKFYYKIFHQHTLIYVRPSSLSKIQLNLMEYCRQKRPLQNLRHPSIMQQGLCEKGLKHLFTGLGYFFSENIQLTRKIIENQKIKVDQIQRFVVTKDQKDFPEKQLGKSNQTSSYVDSQKLLNLKHSCSWLFKILEAITKEIQ